MTFVLKDRVRETSTTTGTGDITLAGAVSGYRAFSAVCSTNDTFWYAIVHSATAWETGLGTYSASNTLTRTTVLESSNGGSAVSFGPGTKDVFIDLPASKVLIPGQMYGTTTNDNASSGNIGEYVQGVATNSAANVTITIASPGVVSETAHGRGLGSPVTFSTTGALPTGLTSGTVYWVIPIDANSYKVATTIANAIAATAVNTSGSQSGTQSASGSILMTTAAD